MKSRNPWVEMLLLFGAFLFLMWGIAAWAAEPVVCTLTTATGSSAITSSPSTGTCTWGKGAVVLMVCTTDTYVDSTTVTSGTVAQPNATSADQLIDFTNNKDPYPIYLDARDQHIAVRAVTTAGTCSFMTTQRKKPF